MALSDYVRSHRKVEVFQSLASFPIRSFSFQADRLLLFIQIWTGRDTRYLSHL